MNEDNPSEGEQEGRTERPLGPTHSPRTWRTCCLAPTIGLVLVLLIVGVAGLNNAMRHGILSGAGIQSEQQAKKKAFITFGNNFFSIARRADSVSKAAFRKLHALSAGIGSVKDMQEAFREAARANRQASIEYKSLDIPQILSSRQKLTRSLDSMSKAYTAREIACETLADWNGDRNDELTKNRYIFQVQRVQQFTEDSLRNLIQAADDNGMTRDDLRHLVSGSILK